MFWIWTAINPAVLSIVRNRSPVRRAHSESGALESRTPEKHGHMNIELISEANTSNTRVEVVKENAGAAAVVAVATKLNLADYSALEPRVYTAARKVAVLLTQALEVGPAVRPGLGEESIWRSETCREGVCAKSNTDIGISVDVDIAERELAGHSAITPGRRARQRVSTPGPGRPR
jgi:hypothetical protein